VAIYILRAIPFSGSLTGFEQVEVVQIVGILAEETILWHRRRSSNLATRVAPFVLAIGTGISE
jgi:hypothetical protein